MNLEDAGFRVDAFPGSIAFLEQLESGWRAETAALLILDLEMPGPSGFQVLKRLQAVRPDLPVIMLTAHSSVGYEDAAFAAGAVDFVDKARGFSILLHRIRRLLGPSGTGTATTGVATPAAIAASPGVPKTGESVDEQTDSACLERGETIGRLRLVGETHRAYWDGTEVDLTVMEFRLVQHLAQRPGQDLRYRTLYDHMRGAGFVAGTGEQGYRDNVRSAIKRVRQKFKAVDPTFSAIENYPGFGYRWSNKKGII